MIPFTEPEITGLINGPVMFEVHNYLSQLATEPSFNDKAIAFFPSNLAEAIAFFHLFFEEKRSPEETRFFQKTWSLDSPR